MSEHLYSMAVKKKTDSIEDRQSDRIFRHLYFNVEEGQRTGFRLEILLT